MAKKSSPKFSYDFPLTVTFALLSAFVFILDILAFKGRLFSLLVCHGSKASDVAFNFKSPADYAGLVFHAFVNRDFSMLFTNLLVIILLGQTLEERYGSLMLAVMMCISVLVSGVLTACISTVPLVGGGSLIFMMTVLVSLTELTKKRIPFSCLLVFLLFLCLSFYRNSEGYKGIELLQKNVGVLVELIGGLCGSIFGFLVLPKKKPVKKAEKTIVAIDDDDLPAKKESWSANDETVIGSIDL